MRRGVAMAVAVVCVHPEVALAQGVDPDALDRHAIALRRQGRDAEALDEFRQSYAARPSARTRAQIGLAEQALGRWVDAEADLRGALEAEGDPWIQRNRAILAAGLADIAKHLGSLEIETDVPGAEVWVNGVRAGVAPLAAPLRVESGTVVVEVRAPGYAAARRTTAVEAGESAREAIHLVPAVPEAPPTAAAPGKERADRVVAPSTTNAIPAARVGRPSRPDPAMRAASFALLGLGAVGLSLGTYFGVRTLATKSDRDARCGPVACTDWTGVALDQEARMLAVRSTAWFVLGAAAAGSGLVLSWMSASSPRSASRVALRLGIDAASRRGEAWMVACW